MTSTFSSNLKIELIGTGDQSGTWGSTTNNNLGTLLEEAIVGYTTQAVTSASVTTLTIPDGTSSVGRKFTIKFTGVTTALAIVEVPAVSKVYLLDNSTTGGFPVTVRVTGQTGVTIPNNKKALVYCDGTDVRSFSTAPIEGSTDVVAFMNSILSGSGSSQYGVYLSPTFSAVASGTQYGIRAAAIGATGTYTTSLYYGYRASDYVKGTGQTLTSQYGFSTASLLAGTFNYGFQSNVSGSASVSLSSISRASSVVSVSTSASHGLLSGDNVSINGATSSFNGVFTVTTVGSLTSFQYSQTGSDETGTASQGYSTKANNWAYYTSSNAPSFLAGPTVISVDSGMDALRITQVGGGNAITVEDSANPDSTPFIIDASGNAIVGGTKAQTFANSSVPKLQTQVTDSGGTGVIRYSADTGGANFRLAKSRGAQGVQVIVQTDDNIGTLTFEASDGTNEISAAAIQAQVDGTPGTADMPTRLIFSTTADGASAVTERMRINSSGAIGLNGANFGTAGQVPFSAGPNAPPVWTSLPSNITLGTQATLTTQTNVDFAVPTTAKRINVMFNGLSTSGSNDLIVQLGTASAFEATGYVSSLVNNGGTTTTSTAGFIFSNSVGSSNLLSGMMIINMMNSATNTWAEIENTILSGGQTRNGAGVKSLSGALTRVRITTAGGTDTFDAGTINISYE